ncbi:MAG: DEAD/DEAH box helicase [Dechloromonas sp.]|nr:DEAD/DEAH box helicase [Dechloromonas sp.]
MTAREFKPHEYQKLIIDHILTHDRCAVWAGMGLGKTSSTLTAIDALRFVEDGPMLVLAPSRVCQTTWPEETQKWAHTQHIKVSPVTGPMKDRVMGVNRHADVFACNYENLPWLIDYWGDKWPYSTVIADESTKLKSFRLRQGGKRAQAFARVAHTKVKRFVELTGTPSPNGLMDLWGQMWFIDRGQRLGRTFDAFKQRWFRPHPSGFGYVPFAHAQAEIQALLSDVCLSIEAKDWFDLREPIVNNIVVDMPARARQAYEELEAQMFTELDSGHELEAFNAAARTIKCLQLASGAAYVGEGNNEWQELHDQKIQALEEIVEESGGEPILVAYHFKSDLARLKKAFPKGRELDKDPKTLKAWNKGEIPLLFAHPQSAGHGLNLQDGGRILVFFSHWWNLEERLQIIERIGPTRQLQAGHDRSMFIHNLIARDTVDEMVIERVETKREVQDILMAAMKRKGLKK